MAVEIESTLSFLLGCWSIERRIDDHRERVRTRFSGEAVVAREADAAVYRETGEIRHGGYRGPARRTLLLAELADGTVQVDFQDGRPFLELDLGAGSWSAVHPCRADSYMMGFEVLDAGRIRETWRVRGPAKDYAAETIWQRR